MKKIQPKETFERIQEREEKKANLGTLYDMNLFMYSKIPSMDTKRQDEYIQNAAMWFSSKPENKYFMFYCKELSDFTIFNFVTSNYARGKEELISLIQARAKEVKDIVYNHDTDSYDFWIVSSLDGQVHMYKLFMCKDFIIEV